MVSSSTVCESGLGYFGEGRCGKTTETKNNLTAGNFGTLFGRNQAILPNSSKNSLVGLWVEGRQAVADTETVFLSCVSKDLASHRLSLKNQFAEAGMNLVVQDDFADSGSPYGTLLKIFAQIQQCDMVVQLLGSYQSHRVPAKVCEEMLAVRPDFQRWANQRGLLSAFRAGAISYVEFEGYAALFLGKELFPLRYQNGGQSEYESRLRKLGRHVEAKLDQLHNLLPRVQAQFQQMARVGRADAQRCERSLVRRADLILLAIVGCCIGIAFLLQLHSAGLIKEQTSFTSFVTEFVYFASAMVACVLLQCGIIAAQLRFDFIFRTAIRNGSAMFAIFAVLSFLSLQFIKWLALFGNSWFGMVIAASAVTLIGYVTDPPKRKSVWVWVIGVPLNFLLLLLTFFGAAWLADFPLVFHWFWIATGLVVLGCATYYDNKTFELETEHGTSDLTPGVKERSSQLFWTARQTVMDARKVDDLGHDF